MTLLATPTRPPVNQTTVIMRLYDNNNNVQHLFAINNSTIIDWFYKMKFTAIMSMAVHRRSMQCSTHSFWLSYFKTSNFIIVFFSISVWRVGRVRPSFMYGLYIHLHYNIDLFVQLCHSRSYPTARVTTRAVYLCTHCTRVHLQRPQPWIKITSHLQRVTR